MGKKVLIIRNFASEVNIDSYNLQEIGMGKAFVKRGYDCDVIYYNNKNFDQMVYQHNQHKLTVKWTKAIKFMSNSIYLSLLNKRELKGYDMIISTEYNQIMTFLLSVYCKDTLYLYHGPYRDNNNKLIRSLYDAFLTPIIARNIKKVYVKSELAKEYLFEKGFQEISTIGVGLDIEKIEEDSNIRKDLLENIRAQLRDKKNLLYIGRLEEARNTSFLIKLIAEVSKFVSNINLVLIGEATSEDLKKYLDLIRELNVEKNIIHIPKLRQSELKYIYKEMDIFLFPSNYDIFGMVLLESMYYQLPIISTLNGGSQTLLKNNNKYIMDNLEIKTWSKMILGILNDSSLKEELRNSAKKNILKNYTWDNIVNKILS
ncbi:glycosyltransferase family 4 protein [Fictibacillus iocasae]|uniref:Glycosyltransferase family 4 protein n=1 Tax=Fictibacillus iocasae TaxID=2715437 RepID=A0ABW2NQ96_9BACL